MAIVLKFLELFNFLRTSSEEKRVRSIFCKSLFLLPLLSLLFYRYYYLCSFIVRVIYHVKQRAISICSVIGWSTASSNNVEPVMEDSEIEMNVLEDMDNIDSEHKIVSGRKWQHVPDAASVRVIITNILQCVIIVEDVCVKHIQDKHKPLYQCNAYNVND